MASFATPLAVRPTKALLTRGRTSPSPASRSSVLSPKGRSMGFARRPCLQVDTPPSIPEETASSKVAEFGLFKPLDVPDDPSSSPSPLGAAGSPQEIVELDTTRLAREKPKTKSSSTNGAPKSAPTWNVPDSVWLTGAPQYWTDGHFGQGVVVGVIDSGIDRTHPCLEGRVLKQVDYTNEKNIDPSEYNGHGTHVAGTIGALPVSEEHNLAGVAPGVVFHDYRVFPRDGGAGYGTIAAAINQAVDDGCDIINMSLGGPSSDRRIRRALEYARSKGVSVICAGGNEGSGQTWNSIIRRDEISYPAFYPETLAVACVDLDVASGEIKFVSFSNTNKLIDVAADGYKLISCWPGSSYLSISGTSMATPCVAGMAALLFSRIANRSGKDVAREMNIHALLKAEAVDIFDGSEERNNVAGYGLCTLLSEIPVYDEGIGAWRLPNLNNGAPAS